MAARTRRAEASDAAELLQLMRLLAELEGYAARFAVTEAELLARGLGREQGQGQERAQFTAFVAEAAANEPANEPAENEAAANEPPRLSGYAVVYEVPFTYDLRPTLVLKELYVREGQRAAGVGRALMAAVLAHGRGLGCGRIKWQVLPSNQAAKAFYRRLGGRPEAEWEAWIRVLDAEGAP